MSKDTSPRGRRRLAGAATFLASVAVGGAAGVLIARRLRWPWARGDGREPYRRQVGGKP